MSKYDIAIIGMGCVFPEANNVKEYWENIVSGEQFVKEMPTKYWHMDQFFSKERKNHKTYTKEGCFIKEFEFDALKYKLPPKSFDGVDISQLVAIEATRQALEDAGIQPHSKDLENAITIIGGSGVDEYAHVSLYLNRFKFEKKIAPYLKEQGLTDSDLDKLHEEFSKALEERGHKFHPTSSAVGAVISSVPNRLAQVFGIKGSNMCVDGACASSFVSLSIACQALMAGDAKIAISGGIDMGINPAIYIGFARLGGLSENGKTNPFDETANGLVIGEGGGIVILKRLEDAIADGNEIKAVIRGIGATSDGAGQAIYNPSVKQRSIALQKALDISEVKAQDIQFLEAHATSTVVGDANEYDAISTVYSNRDKKDPLYLGTVKHQIGHLKAAAGVAGLIKTVLAMNEGKIPHMPRFRKLTKYASQKSDSLVIPNEMLEWKKRPNGSRYGAITTSGFGGVNYHAIIETADSYKTSPRTSVDRRMAIVGVACRLPGATDHETFWKNMENQKNCFVDADIKKLGWEENFGKNVPDGEKINTKKISLIDDYKINYVRHKVSPNSVSQISPAQLLAVDISDTLLTQYGLDIKDNKNIGVSIGAIHDDNYSTISFPLSADEYAAAFRMTGTYKKNKKLEETLQKVVDQIVEDGPPHTEATLPGWMSNINAGIVANRLNCNGPNFTVDTACSSGIASMLPAMYHLMFTDIEMMIAGGLNRHTTNVFISTICGMGAMADEVPAPFDATGKGFLTGEGGAVYLLKRYSDAVKDGDEILSVIENVSGSSEYKSKTMFAPSESAVRYAIAEAVKGSGVKPERIGVVDTHGSANLVSDVAEVNAIAKELRGDNNAPAVHVTAVKSHVGHIFGGSGAAGIMSVMQSLRHRKVPGIQNLKNYRPEITPMLDKAKPQMGNTELEAQFDAGAVTSIGLGGANYCVIMSSPQTAGVAPKSSKNENNIQSVEDVFVITANNTEELKAKIEKYLKSNNQPDSNDASLCLAVSFDSKETLKKKLESAMTFISKGMSLKPLESQGIYFNSKYNAPTGKLAFCFPGQGTHYVGMGKHLYHTNPTFKKTVDQVDALAVKLLNFNLKELLYSPKDENAAMDKLSTIEGAQISAFAVEVAIYNVLTEMGIKPDVMIGHSFGEISALAAQGVWDIETAFKVVVARINAANLVANSGQKLKMMSVACTEDQMKIFLNLGGDDVVLSNIHAPGQYIIAGKESKITEISKTAETFGVEAKMLSIASAFHSKFMADAVVPFKNELEKLPCNQPSVPLLSTITGKYIAYKDNRELADILSQQLVTQLNMPREISQLYHDGVREFLEIGPKWALSKMIEATLSGKDINAIPTIHPKIGDEETFRRAKAYLISIGKIKVQSAKVDDSFIGGAFLQYLQEFEPAVLALLDEAKYRFENGGTAAKRTVKPISSIATPAVTVQTTAKQSAAQPAKVITAPVKLSKEEISTWIIRGKKKLAAATGYPEDMLDENLDLEADLGIDSIQRAEIWFSFVKEFGLNEEARPQKIGTLTDLATELAKLAGGSTHTNSAAPASTPTKSVGDISVWINRGRKKLAASTGYPEEMLDENLDLEADLGIDSIQRAEIWYSFVQEYGLSEEARPQKISTLTDLATELAKLAGGGEVEISSPVQSSNNGGDIKEWIERGRKKLSASTGYPEEMLGADLDLEADLGIDSIQRAEIWYSFVKEYGLDETSRPQKITTLTDLATELAKLAGGSSSSSSATASVSVATQPAASSMSSDDLQVWIDRGRKKLSASTGYPEEMLDENLDLEADLGIDSIQRAEIWYSFVKEYGLDETSRPQKIATLTNLASELLKLSSGEKTSESASETVSASNNANSGASPVNQLFYSGVSSVDKSQIKDFDCKKILAVVATEKEVKSWASLFKKTEKDAQIFSLKAFKEMEDSAVKGIVDSVDTVYILFHESLLKSDKQGSELAKLILATAHDMFAVFKKMATSLKVNGKRIVCPISQDGAFGAGKDNYSLQGSFPAGFIRSLHYELTKCKFQLIDTGSLNWQTAVERSISINFGTIEVGILNNEWVYPTLSTITKTANNYLPLAKNDLVLVTGGARGIVFECVFRLAEKTKCKLLLTGRTELAKGDEEWLQASADTIDKVMHELEISLVKSKKMNLGEAKRFSSACKSQWEVNYNLKRLKEAGVEAMYEKCDVVDNKALKDLIKKVTAKEKIRGIVHGAGIQKSKLFEELAADAISRTIETKLNPLFVMLEELNFEDIKLLSAFGSIAGLFGNMGQTDYALANDVLACSVSAIGQKYKNTIANTVEWTAWVGTGMATEAETKRFAEMGLNPVTVETGVDLFDQAVTNAKLPRLAAFNKGAEFASNREISNYVVSSQPKDYLLTDKDETVVIPTEDIYVNQHLVQHTPVVPGTFITEMLMESLEGSGMSVANVKFRRPLQVKNTLKLEVVKYENGLLVLPKDRPALEGKALVNLSFSGCNLKKVTKIAESKLPKVSDKIKTQLLEEGKKVGNLFYEKLDAKFSYVLKSGPIFRGAKAVLKDNSLFYGHLYLTDDAVKMFDVVGKFIVNPIISDMAIQVAAAWGILDMDVMAIPYEFGEMHVYNKAESRDAIVICEAISQNKEEAHLHLTVRDWNGKILFSMRDVILKTIPVQ